MSILNEREKFVLSLIIVGGNITHYFLLQDIILQNKGPFNNISEKHLKNKALKNTLNKLTSKNYINKTMLLLLHHITCVLTCV